LAGHLDGFGLGFKLQPSATEGPSIQSETVALFIPFDREITICIDLFSHN
jgi:hypothetical protein